MARLTALGVCDSGLSSLAIPTFKEAFEVERPPIDEDASSNLEPLIILVPECIEWIQHCGHKLLTLATMNHTLLGSFRDKRDAELKTSPLASNEGLSLDR
jgi:hypothetical protein